MCACDHNPYTEVVAGAVSDPIRLSRVVGREITSKVRLASNMRAAVLSRNLVVAGKQWTRAGNRRQFDLYTMGVTRRTRVLCPHLHHPKLQAGAPLRCALGHDLKLNTDRP